MAYVKQDPLAEFLEAHANYYRVGLSPGTALRVTPGPAAPIPTPTEAPRSRNITFAELVQGFVKVALPVAAVVGAAVLINEATMTKRKRHDREVKRAANEELRKGRPVAADIKGWPRPPMIGSHRGDVYSIDDDGTETVIEVEHVSTVFNAHSMSQVDTFDRWAARSKNRVSVLRLTDA